MVVFVIYTPTFIETKLYYISPYLTFGVLMIEQLLGHKQVFHLFTLLQIYMLQIYIFFKLSK